MRGVRGVVLRTSSLIVGLVLIVFGAGAAPRAEAETAWLGLVAGPPASSETVQAADMARLFEKDGAFRVVPMLGDAGAGNIALLLNDPSVDVAFVSIDALSAAAATDPTLSDRLELVVRLAPQEIHVLARTDIDSVADLAGGKVSFGPVGSSSAATAAALFKALSISVEAESLDASAAIERLKQGTIDAAVIVGGKPYPLIGAVPANSGVHLLLNCLRRPPRNGLPANPHRPARLSQSHSNWRRGADRCDPHGAARGKGRSAISGARRTFRRSAFLSFCRATGPGATPKMA